MKRFWAITVAVSLGLAAVTATPAGAKTTCSSTAKKKNGGKCPTPTTTTKKPPPPPIFTQAGNGTAQTATFKVPDNWNLLWSYDCSTFFGGSGNFIVTIYDYYPASKSQIDFDNQGVNQLGRTGNGVEHYHSGGNTKYFSISSECSWTVTVTKA